VSETSAAAAPPLDEQASPGEDAAAGDAAADVVPDVAPDAAPAAEAEASAQAAPAETEAADGEAAAE